MTELALPKIDKKIIDRKDEIVKNLSKISGSDNVLSHPDEVKPYETDALAAYTQTPLSVILPKAVPGTIATPASCIALLENSEPSIPVPITLGKA